MSTNLEILSHTPEIISPEKLQTAREALAKRWGMALDQIPDDSRILKLFNKSLDDLSDTIKGQANPLEKARILKEKLASIDMAEAADKAKELSETGKSMFTSEALEKTSTAIHTTAEKLVDTGLTHSKEAVAAVGAIAGAQSIGEATKGVDGLAKVIESGGKAISTAIDTIKNICFSLFQMLGLDKLFKSIGKLFGMDFPEDEKKPGEETKTDVSSPSDALKDAVKKLETKEGRQEFIHKISNSLGDKISDTYFGGAKLSEPQMKKLYNILNENLNTESLTKLAERYARGEIQLGELFDATFDMLGAYPAKVMWELSFSGIIPFWAITQHVVLDPAGNLMKLTFDGIGFPVSSISLDQFGSMLEKKAKDGDSHALDMARIQLYGVNSILFRTLGEVLSITTAAGIMLTDTTTGVDGFRLANLSRLKDYDTLAAQFGKIESVLSKGGDVGDFGHMLQGVKDIHTNAIIMGAVSTNTVAGKLDHKKIVDTLRVNPDLKGVNIRALESVIGDENKFRDALKNLIQGPSSSASWGQAVKRYASKFSGGKNGEALRYLEQVDAVKKGQISLIGDVGMMSEKMRRLKLAYESLKLARAGDTVILHMENMEDISKFRAFLSTIPGGIRALSEVIPAASLAISLGSVAWDARDKKDGTTGESLMDVCKTALLPAYGTWGIIRDKTVNFGEIITKGKMPEFSDIALTGVVGGVFIYEVTRVWTGVAQVGSGVISMDSKLAFKGLSKLTYMHDIGRGFGQVGRGLQNMKALASKPIVSPEFTKTLAKVAQKLPKKGRLAIGAALLTIAGGAYAYMSGPESPEDIEKSLQKDGWIDADKHITDKLKSAFYQKSPTERKQLLDELFLMYRGSLENLPSTYYDEKKGAYGLVSGNTELSSIIDSNFRHTIQSLGVDIEIL